MCMWLCCAVDGMGINFLNVAKFNLPNVSQHWCILHYLTCQRVLKPQNPTVCRSWHENNLWTLLWALGMNTLTCVMLHVLGRELVVVRGRGEGGAELWLSVCPLWWGGVVTGVIRWHWPPAPSQYYTQPLHSFLSSIVTADGLTWSNE